MLRDQVLSLLEQQRGAVVSGEQLASDCGVSRAAVWKAIDRLRKDGIAISAEMGGGYRLSDADDSFTLAGVQALLHTQTLGKQMVIVSQTTSTNTVLKRDYATQQAHGFVYASAEQTAGRGRMGRTFASPSQDGLYTSVLLRPALPLDKLHFVTLATAVAVCQTIECICGFRPSIKWVNDVLMEGKKLCGILTEAAIEGESGRIDYVVVGIGINLRFDAQKHPELAEIACGLGDFCDCVPRRAQLLAELLLELERQVDLLMNGQYVQILDSYRAYLCCLDCEITVIQGENRWQARALDINPAGHLVVRDAQKQLHTLSTGEISIRLT